MSSRRPISKQFARPRSRRARLIWWSPTTDGWCRYRCGVLHAARRAVRSVLRAGRDLPGILTAPSRADPHRCFALTNITVNGEGRHWPTGWQLPSWMFAPTMFPAIHEFSIWSYEFSDPHRCFALTNITMNGEGRHWPTESQLPNWMFAPTIFSAINEFRSAIQIFLTRTGVSRY
jgi:hypothetical protein